MNDALPDREVVLTTWSRDECLESRLVLLAKGISAETISSDDGWMLAVHPRDLAAAAAELAAYREENREPTTPSSIALAYGGAKTGVVTFAVVNLLVGSWEAQSAFGLPWLSAGGMQAGRVMAGEWWRTVTALTLHADIAHISSNLVFGALFGFLAGQAMGGGVAWLAILLAGALGNLVNAVVQPPEHVSIGASTAVFAALGLIVAHALRPQIVPQNAYRRWSPLIGGVLLLAFLGVGDERTDVMAHATGFMAGVVVGWLGCSLPPRWLANAYVQSLAGLAAIGIVACAWIVGLLTASLTLR